MLDEEPIRHGIETGGHNGEMQFVGWVAGNMVEVGQHAEQNVVVVRRGVVDDLPAHGRHAPLNLGRDGVDAPLDSLFAKVGNHPAEAIVTKVVHHEFVAELIDAATKVDDSAVGLLLIPSAVSVIMVHSVLQFGSGTRGETETGIGQLGKHRSRITVARCLLQSQSDHLGFILSSGIDKNH